MPRSPRWMSYVLWLAAIYNLAWGSLVILFPVTTLGWTGLTDPTYPQLWQCIGMIVGVYGIGYAIAAGDPVRHWPIVLVGFLGKTLGPIGFVDGYLRGDLPFQMFYTNITNDLIWWPFFAMILLHAFRESQAPAVADRPFNSLREALGEYHNQRGENLLKLSYQEPLLVVCLRHLGCTFCRETLADLKAQAEPIAAQERRIVLVHMASNEEMEKLLSRYELKEVDHISDPSCRLYRALGLERGSLNQVLGLAVWWPGLKAILKGHSIGRLRGDGFQMPGAFLIEQGELKQAFRARTSADHPDYACDFAATTETSASA